MQKAYDGKLLKLVEAGHGHTCTTTLDWYTIRRQSELVCCACQVHMAKPSWLDVQYPSDSIRKRVFGSEDH